MSRKPGDCAFCGGRATTMDHIPSRKFFPTPRPSNLITVPACGRCNGITSDDEEYFLIRILAHSGAGTDEALAVAKQRFGGVLTPRRFKALKRLANETERVAVTSPAGIHLRDEHAYSLEPSIVQRVLEKIVRGLYFHEFRRRVPEGHSVTSYFEPNRAVFGEPTVQALLRTQSRMRGRTVFEYKYQVPSDNPNAALFLMLFFGGIVAVGAVIREEHAARLRMNGD